MTGAWVFLPTTALFALPVADTRAALSTITLRQAHRFRVDAAIAADFPLVRWDGPVSVDVGIEAGVWMGFNPSENLKFALETVDGTFGFPVAVRAGPWSARLLLAHTSAHFADGVQEDGREIADASLGYSREWLQVQAARDLSFGRIYTGGRVLIHDQREAAPFAVQAGGEVAPQWKLAPYFAVDVQLAEEFDWLPAVSGQLGAWATLHDGERLRVALAARTGPDDVGKLSGDPEAWLGVIFGLDRTGALSAAAAEP